MFGEKLRKYREKKHLTQNQLAYRVEVLTGMTCKGKYISSYESGSNPKVEFIVAFADILEIPVQYLFDDSDEVIRRIIKNEMPRLEKMFENTIRVPVVGGFINRETSEKYIYIDKYLVKKKYRESVDLKAVIVLGDSMKPYIDNSDIVLFEELGSQQGDKFNDGKYVIETEQGVMVKNLTFKVNGDIIISNCNKDYRDCIVSGGIPNDYFDVLGVVVGRLLKG